MTLAILFFLSLALGSFANVYFYRYPIGISVVFPRSFCPNCRRQILWSDNIPVLSYLILKGKCRYCLSKISLKYPAVEFLCAILLTSVLLKFRHSSIIVQTGFIFFSYIVFLIGGIDLTTFYKTEKQYGIIPDHLPVILAISGILFSFHNPFFQDRWWMSLIAGLGGILLMIAFRSLGYWIFKREALGLGDVKMMGAVGLWLGWKGIMASLVVGSSIGSLLCLFLIATKKIERNSPIPFGPFLALGAVSALFYL